MTTDGGHSGLMISVQSRIDDELVVHTSSGGDWNGTLFFWSGSLYRGIGPQRAPFYAELFRAGLVQRLCERKLLIDSRIVELPIERFPMVVKHRTIPFVSYPVEWSFGMLKQAALLILDLEIELVPHGLSIHDAHPWNVVFDGVEPYFVDLGAIMPLSDDSIWDFSRAYPLWPAYEQFCQTLLRPLLLMSWGHFRIARGALLDYHGLTEHETWKLAPFGVERSVARASRLWSSARGRTTAMATRLGRRLPLLRRRFAERSRGKPGETRGLPAAAERSRFLASVRERVEAIQLPQLVAGGADYIGGRQDRTSYYSDLHGGRVPPLVPNEDWTPKNRAIADLIARTRPSSVLDLGSSTGWYALLAERLGSRVVATDVDEMCVEHLYRAARDRRANLLPLRMDFRSPTPGVGPCNEWLLPATARLRSDLVLALALVHHLVFKQFLTFDQIARTLAQFSHRWAVVEFMLPEDEWVRDLLRPEFAWYTLENFQNSIEKYFAQVEIFPSHPPNRRILLCEKQP